MEIMKFLIKKEQIQTNKPNEVVEEKKEVKKEKRTKWIILLIFITEGANQLFNNFFSI